MNNLLFVFLLCFAGRLFAFELRPGTQLHFGTVAEGRARLGASSDFTRAMTPLDRRFTMSVDRDPSEADYLAYAARQALSWSAAETNRLSESLQKIRVRLAPLDLPLPPDIYLTKTTGNESFGGSYTGNDFVAWAPEPISPFGALLTQWILTHELFHILTRHNASWRPALYHALGFFDSGPIPLPASFRRILVTNPDALEHSYVILLRDGDRLIPAIPFLYYKATNGLSGRSIQDFAELGIFELEHREGRYFPALTSNGELKKVSEAAHQDYLRKTGNSTHYLIHPEEIAAEHFALSADPDHWPVDSPRVLHLFRTALADPYHTTSGFPAGWFHAQLVAEPAANNLFEYSTDLIQWNARDTFLSALITDTEAFLDSHRFYRAAPIKSLSTEPTAPNSLGWIAPGSLETSDGTVLAITNGFWIARHEVTQGEFSRMMGSPAPNPQLPVANIDWFQANEFCAKLNLAFPRADGLLFRLPTSTEWEYACRAGNSAPYSSGTDFHNLSLYLTEWFGDNSDAHAHPVALKQPNAWGLYDMHGNLQEWCADQLIDSDSITPLIVVRGGTFLDSPRALSPNRTASFPAKQTAPTLGFRLVLGPPL